MMRDVRLDRQSTGCRIRVPLLTAVMVVLFGLLNGCEADTPPVVPDSENPAVTTSPVATNIPDAATASPRIIDIIARGMTFEAPTSIEGGWVTFRFSNESAMEHFAVIERLPDGITVSDQQQAVAPVFQQGMDLLNAGDSTGADAKFAELPAWFGEIVFMGGPGLLSPGEISSTTVFLEPGQYLIECYVKTDGVFHSYNPDPDSFGMIQALEVGAINEASAPPIANVHIKLSTDQGFEITGTAVAGANLVRVDFVDQSAHEHFLGHDVHVAAVPSDIATEDLVAWMNWTLPNGLETPAPVRFLGGSNEMPAGSSAYFSVDLEPGRHVWIAEVPNADSKNMLKFFDIADGSAN